MELDWNLTILVFSIIIGVLLYQFFFRLVVIKSTENEKGRSTYKLRTTSLHKAIFKLLDIKEEDVTDFQAIADRFSTYQELSNAIKKAGLESSNIIIGIDFTASNEWQGRKSFEHRSLHHIFKGKRLNPYQRVITSIAETLAPFDEDNKIPVYGFGDRETKDCKVFSFTTDGSPCDGFKDVLAKYNDVVKRIELSGPTSFAPVIYKAIEIVKSHMSYHILVIIADGQVVEEQEIETRQAIVEASKYPLSIIVVGVGDGPWNVMDEYDEKLPTRQFDNFQFVNYHEATRRAKVPEIAFALNALMEIPDQYMAIRSLGLIRTDSTAHHIGHNSPLHCKHNGSVGPALLAS